MFRMTASRQQRYSPFRSKCWRPCVLLCSPQSISGVCTCVYTDLPHFNSFSHQRRQLQNKKCVRMCDQATLGKKHIYLGISQ